jgi:peptide deformylase
LRPAAREVTISAELDHFAMHEDLKIIHWPDPRLKTVSRPVTAFDESLRSLAGRMLMLMREHKGVGLAAPQVGVNLRLFVINPTGKPEDDRVYVNPELVDPDGSEEGEEGCLSLPEITTEVLRSKSFRIRAQDLQGKAFEQAETGYVARIWQHELDHLNGRLILDHMGPLAKLGARKKLKELEAEYLKNHPPKKK